jgi:hypothetical protein
MSQDLQLSERRETERERERESRNGGRGAVAHLSRDERSRIVIARDPEHVHIAPPMYDASQEGVPLDKVGGAGGLLRTGPGLRKPLAQLHALQVRVFNKAQLPCHLQLRATGEWQTREGGREGEGENIRGAGRGQ